MRERIEGQESAIRALTVQRDLWLQWAKQFTGKDNASWSELLDLVKAKVKAITEGVDGPAEHTMCGTMKVTQLKGDVVASDGSWAMLKHGNAVIAGNIPASKLTLGEEMKEAIREVIRDEIADLNKAVVDILSKMRK